MLSEDYMKQALQLARRGLGKTSPNPVVGAIIVKDNRIIGKGYHHYFGGKHAEVNAIENAREDVNGATMYVTLEPCCHYGKTPPCVDAIIQNNIGKVIIGMRDPDKRVSGRSIKILRQHGIKCQVGILEEECHSLNEAYIKHRSTGLPFVTVKFAQTLDGRIATATGNSRWLSSPASRRLAHKLRTQYDTVMVGIGTVITDNPQLTVRLVRGRNPTRIVLDSGLRVPLEAKVLTNQEAAPTIIATTSKAENDKLSALRRMGIEVLIVPQDEQGNVALPHLLEALGKRGISSVLVEGGSEIITSLLRQKLADKLVVIVAPKLLGKGIEAVGDLNITDVGRALELSFRRIYRSGEDLVIEAKVNPTYQRHADSA